MFQLHQFCLFGLWSQYLLDNQLCRSDRFDQFDPFDQLYPYRRCLRENLDFHGVLLYQLCLYRRYLQLRQWCRYCRFVLVRRDLGHPLHLCLLYHLFDRFGQFYQSCPKYLEDQHLLVLPFDQFDQCDQCDP